MSDLKWRSVAQLEGAKRSCEQTIAQLESKVNGQRTRLEWINKYLYEKTPQELSMAQIEQRLGHKVIIR